MLDLGDIMPPVSIKPTRSFTGETVALPRDKGATACMCVVKGARVMARCEGGWPQQLERCHAGKVLREGLAAGGGWARKGDGGRVSS